MSGKAAAWLVIGLLAAALCAIHRRAIRAAVRGEKLPPAPRWHVWMKKEHRRP